MKKLYYNAKFYAINENRDVYQAILVDNGVIVDTFIDNIPSIDAEKISLNHSYVYPGFIDTHTHSFEGGLYSKGLDCSGFDSIAQTLDMLAQAKKISGMIFAWNFDELSMQERRFPNLEELDHILPDTPLLLRRVDGHSCVINTFAKKMIQWHYPLPDPFTGLLKGDLNDNAAHFFHKALNDESIFEAYQNAEKIALENGHTTIHSMIGDAKMDILHFPLMSRNLDRFIIDYKLYPQSFNISRALENQSNRIGGCILADGSFGSHTAALLEPYSDQPECLGMPYHHQDYWNKFVSEAHDHDLQVGVHCIGDYAITQLINAIEYAQKRKEKDLRHQIIHCELLSDEMIQRMAKLNISAVMQPSFDYYWGGQKAFYHKVLGWDRAKKTTRLKSLMDAGVLVTGSSDWYVTPLNALSGIDSAVNIHHSPERINRFEAIKLYTSNAARLIKEEQLYGTLEKGKYADFVCLDQDIFNADSIRNIKILDVYKKGMHAFSRKD